VFVSDDREGLDPQVHTHPGPVSVLRAAPLVVQRRGDTGDGDDPAAALEPEAGRVHVEPAGPEHLGELAGVLVNPELTERREPKAPRPGCPHR
jgi:hypothetical protein